MILQPENYLFQSELQKLQEGEPFMPRTYMVLMNWYSYYGEVYDKLRKHIANISERKMVDD